MLICLYIYTCILGVCMSGACCMCAWIRLCVCVRSFVCLCACMCVYVCLVEWMWAQLLLLVYNKYLSIDFVKRTWYILLYLNFHYLTPFQRYTYTNLSQLGKWVNYSLLWRLKCWVVSIILIVSHKQRFW